MTPMGGRLLEDMLRHPWREAAPHPGRADAVALLHDDDNRRALLREALKDVYDLERLSTRVTVNRPPAGFHRPRQQPCGPLPFWRP